MTQSTNDDSFIWSSYPIKYDCVVYNYTVGQVNHLFNIWIINKPDINITFKCKQLLFNIYLECYFQYFEAFICINSESNETFKEVYAELRFYNQKVQKFHTNQLDEVIYLSHQSFPHIEPKSTNIHKFLNL